jgi:hypothetical protein
MANPELYSNYTNIKTGKVLAYIGLVLSILYLLLVIWMLLTFGFEGMQDQQLMEEKMRELLGQ